LKTADIFEIKRFAVHDGDGIRTTVFFKGCSLNCLWCHNPEGISFDNQLAYFRHKCINCGECTLTCNSGSHNSENGIHILDRTKCISCGKCADVCLGDALLFYGKEYSVDKLLNIVLEDKEYYFNSGGGVTLSGGECLLQADFCTEFLKRLKSEGINTAVDTSGFVNTESFEKVAPYTDTFLYDIKAIDPDVHIKCTGKPNDIILENLIYIDSLGKRTEIRIPYVPGYNDNQMEKIADFLINLKNVACVRILPYHNYAKSKYDSLGIKNTLPQKLPEKEEIRNAKRIFISKNIIVKD